MKHAIPITFLPKRNLVNFFLPFFWCILVSSSCKSQNPYFEEIPHENYLWSSFVTSSYQDKKGFLWFGTGSGCHRFDGYEVKSFQPNKNSPNSLSHPVVWSITGEGDNIWIGTENGLNCLHVPTEKFTRYFYDAQDTNSISSNSIETVFVSKKSELWVGTKNGWNRKRPGANGFTRLFFDEKKPKESRGILEDKMGIIWLSAADSLFKYNPKSNEIIAYGLPGAELPESPEKNLIRVLFEDSFGSLWIGTDQNGLYCLNKKTGLITNHLFYQPKNEGSLGNNRISALEEDDQGFLWIGTYGGGLHFLNLNTGKLIRCIGSKKTIFYATVIRTILKDSAGNLWLGTEYEGFWVVKRHRKPFRNFKATESGFNTTKITGFSEGLNGKIWIASYSGVHLFDPQTESFIHIFDNAKPEEPSTIKNIFQIQRDKNEGLWVATDKALYHMNKNGEFTSIFEGSGGNNPCGSWLTAFLIDDTDQIWIGSQQGLCRYSLSEKKFQSYLLAHEPKNFNSNNSISSISKDRSKRLWICTKGGINLYIPSTDTFQYFPYEKQVHGIHEDNNGNLWLSAYQQFCTIDIENKIIRPFNGLGEKILFPLGVLSDDDGYIWFVVYEGVYRFNPLNGRYVFYNVNDGLGNGKIMAGLFYQPSDKKLFFGGIDWFSWFNPKEILQNDFIPSIQLVDFQLSNKSVPIKGSSSDTLGFKSPLTYNISYTNEIILTYKQNNFSFSFAALDYTASEKNQYRYRLIGYDQQWVYTNSGHRIATFTNLDPGRYTFEVQGSNNDGKWNFNNPATVTITIRPPWWKTWWASCLWGGLVIAILSFIRRYEIRRQITKTEARRLKELDTAKSRLYTNISHEFRTPLTVILGLLDNLTGKVYESGKESLKVIKRNAHQLLHLVNQMLDLARLDSSNLHLKLVRGDVIRYIRYLLESFHSYAANKNITIDFQAEAPSLEMDFDPDRFQQVISNLLSNAIKFTPSGGEIKVRVREANKNKVRRLQLYIRDTGIGIPEAKIPFIFDRFYQADDSSTRTNEGAGIGLALTRELVQLMGGEITVSSKAGKGTRFAIHLPVTREAEKTEAIPLPDSSDVLFTPEAESRLPPHDSPEKESALSILLIEDNPDVLRYLSGCLTPAYRIETAGNGEQGITKAIQQIPDLIISDIMMPVRDGFEVCDTLKKDERTSHIPIILLTAKADQASKLTGLAKGADAYLPKPFNKAELLIRIQNLLKNRERLRQFLLAGESLHLYPEKSLVQVNAEKTALKFIHKVRSVVESHISNPQFSVAMLAELIHYSEPQLNRKVKGIIDMTPGKYIRSVRLALAQRLLRGSDLSITDIAFECGFLDPEYFSKVFKQETELTPTEYRNLNG